jgi:hypothetical protein
MTDGIISNNKVAKYRNVVKKSALLPSGDPI